MLSKKYLVFSKEISQNKIILLSFFGHILYSTYQFLFNIPIPEFLCLSDILKTLIKNWRKGNGSQMKYASEDIAHNYEKPRYPGQYEEEEEIINYALLKTYLETYGHSCYVGGEPLQEAFENTVRSIHDNYYGDEMPQQLRKYVKRIFYINSVCAKNYGENFVKCCINLDRAESAGGKDMLKIYILLDGMEYYQEHFENLQDDSLFHNYLEQSA